MNRHSNLDALRGLLAGVVTLAHAWSVFLQPLDQGQSTPAAYVVGISARIAVLAFFTLSGYVIAATIAGNIARNGRFAVAEYATARAFRIVPPLLAVMALVLAIEFVLRAVGANASHNKHAIRAVFSTDVPGQLQAIVTLGARGQLTGNWLNGPLWSLVYEMQAYVLAGLLAIALTAGGWRRRVVALLLLVGYVHAIHLPSTFLTLQAACLAAFLAGCIAYRFRGAAASVLLAVACAGIAGAAVRIAHSSNSVLLDMDSATELLSAQVAVAVSSAALLPLVARSRQWGSAALRRVAGYSYTLYIAHMPLLVALYFVAANHAPALLSRHLAPVTAAASLVLVWSLIARLGRAVERPAEQRSAVARLIAGDRVATKSAAQTSTG